MVIDCHWGSLPTNAAKPITREAQMTTNDAKQNNAKQMTINNAKQNNARSANDNQ
jgi:hypothetical protein